MLKNSLDVVRVGVTLRLSLLGHDVGNIDLQGVGGGNGPRDALHQQVRDDAGIQAPRPQQDHIRLGDGVQRRLEGRGTLRQKPYPPDTAVLPLFAVEDFGLPQDPGPVFELRLQLHVAGSHRQDPARDCQHLAHPAHRHVKAAAGDAVQRGQKQIPEALTLQRPLREPVVEQFAHQRLHVGQSLQAVADIPRGQHTQLLAENARTAAVVRHRHNGG